MGVGSPATIEKQAAACDDLVALVRRIRATSTPDLAGQPPAPYRPSPRPRAPARWPRWSRPIFYAADAAAITDAATGVKTHAPGTASRSVTLL
jgi:hypothetical protein